MAGVDAQLEMPITRFDAGLHLVFFHGVPED